VRAARDRLVAPGMTNGPAAQGHPGDDTEP